MDIGICNFCGDRGKHFYCFRCVNSKNFVHSDPRKQERLLDKYINYQLKEREITGLRKQINESPQGPRLFGNTVPLILEKKKVLGGRIKYLKGLLDDKTEKKRKMKEIMSRIRDRNEKRRTRIPEFLSKVKEIRDCYLKLQFHLSTERNKCALVDQRLSIARKHHLLELTNLIFPIKRIDPKSALSSNINKYNNHDDDNDDDVDSNIVEYLADAVSTSYLHGRWVRSCNSQDEGVLKYEIVGPSLLGSGDYSAYHDEESSSSSSDPISPFKTTSAGLTYTCQLVQQIARFLDIILPKKLNFADFNQPLDINIFDKKIAHMNYDIVYICFMHRIMKNISDSSQSLENLVGLFRTENKFLGWHRPLSNQDEFHKLVAPLAANMKTFSDEDDEFDDDSKILNEEEWVTEQDSLMIQAITNTTTNQTTCPMIQPVTASSIVSSIFRGLSGT